MDSGNFKLSINHEKPKKCVHCRKKKGEHQAGTDNCPTGPRTRIGQVDFSKTEVFTPKK